MKSTQRMQSFPVLSMLPFAAIHWLGAIFTPAHGSEIKENQYEQKTQKEDYFHNAFLLLSFPLIKALSASIFYTLV
jgi:hypothetical protein